MGNTPSGGLIDLRSTLRIAPSIIKHTFYSVSLDTNATQGWQIGLEMVCLAGEATTPISAKCRITTGASHEGNPSPSQQCVSCYRNKTTFNSCHGQLASPVLLSFVPTWRAASPARSSPLRAPEPRESKPNGGPIWRWSPEICLGESMEPKGHKS